MIPICHHAIAPHKSKQIASLQREASHGNRLHRSYARTDIRQTRFASSAIRLYDDREFARVPLRAPTIYLALPFICAYWAILCRWAEPHYLASYGLMPARHGGSLEAQGLRGAGGVRFLFRLSLARSERC